MYKSNHAILSKLVTYTFYDPKQVWILPSAPGRYCLSVDQKFIKEKINFFAIRSQCTLSKVDDYDVLTFIKKFANETATVTIFFDPDGTIRDSYATRFANPTSLAVTTDKPNHMVEVYDVWIDGKLVGQVNPRSVHCEPTRRKITHSDKPVEFASALRSGPLLDPETLEGFSRGLLIASYGKDVFYIKSSDKDCEIIKEMLGTEEPEDGDYLSIRYVYANKFDSLDAVRDRLKDLIRNVKTFSVKQELTPIGTLCTNLPMICFRDFSEFSFQLEAQTSDDDVIETVENLLDKLDELVIRVIM